MLFMTTLDDGKGQGQESAILLQRNMVIQLKLSTSTRKVKLYATPRL